MHHALSCNKREFISIRHDSIRDVTAYLLNEVCRDACTEPKLQPLTGERFKESTNVIAHAARCDVSARGFWSASQVEFLYKRVFNPRCSNQSPSKSYKVKEKEKK